MKRVTGIGGVFFKSKDPQKTRHWYQKHLGFNTDQWGTSFEWRPADAPEKRGYTQWSPMSTDTSYMEPSDENFMINYRVEDLEALLPILKEEGVQICGEISSYEYGKFLHILDLEGRKVELWEPVDEEFEKIAEGTTK